MTPFRMEEAEKGERYERACRARPRVKPGPVRLGRVAAATLHHELPVAQPVPTEEYLTDSRYTVRFELPGLDPERDLRSRTLQEPHIDRREHPDDPDVRDQPLPELVPEEHDVHAGHNDHQREHVKHDGWLSSHR